LSHTFPKAKIADYTRTTIKLPQEDALSLDQQFTMNTAWHHAWYKRHASAG